MSEVVNPFDPMIQAAILTEESLRLEVLMLQRYRRKLNMLLAEKHLNPEQIEALRRILEYINDRNLKLYGE